MSHRNTHSYTHCLHPLPLGDWGPVDTENAGHFVDINCHLIIDALMKAIRAKERRLERSASVAAVEEDDVEILTTEQVYVMVSGQLIDCIES
jgi:hypothetical protein